MRAIHFFTKKTLKNLELVHLDFEDTSMPNFFGRYRSDSNLYWEISLIHDNRRYNTQQLDHLKSLSLKKLSTALNMSIRHPSANPWDTLTK